MKLGKVSIVIILISLFVFSLAFPPSSLKLILDSDDSISNVISLEEKSIKLFEEDKESETYSDSIFTILTILLILLIFTNNSSRRQYSCMR